MVDRQPGRIPQTFTLALAVLSMFVLIITYYSANRTHRPPPCVGLRCADDASCGSYCLCERDVKQTYGSCVASSYHPRVITRGSPYRVDK